MKSWLTTNYTCGHTSNKRVEGDRDREWDCPDECVDCRRETERLEALEGAASLPEVTGSPKQIDWAITIRARLLNSLERLDPHEHGIKDLFAAVQHGPRRSDRRVTVEVARSLDLDKIREWALSHTDSRWWIDHRQDHWSALVAVGASTTQPDAWEALTALWEKQKRERTEANDRRRAEQEAREIVASEDRADREKLEALTCIERSREAAEGLKTALASVAGCRVVSVSVETREDWTATLSNGRRVRGFRDHGDWSAYDILDEPLGFHLGRSPESDRIGEEVKAWLEREQE